MSETISIFVGNGPSIEECLTVVEDHLKTSLGQKMDGEGHLFEGVVSGACVTLFDHHGLVDDCGIEFTQLPFEIDFTRFVGANTPDWVEATFLSVAVSLAERLSMQLKSRCIVVKNLQRIVQSFVPPAD